MNANKAILGILTALEGDEIMDLSCEARNYGFKASVEIFREGKFFAYAVSEHDVDKLIGHFETWRRGLSVKVAA